MGFDRAVGIEPGRFLVDMILDECLPLVVESDAAPVQQGLGAGQSPVHPGPFHPVTLYRYYVARFQIEFLFCDSKQFARLTHCQARDGAALTFPTNASLTAVSLSKLQAVQTFFDGF